MAWSKDHSKLAKQYGDFAKIQGERAEVAADSIAQLEYVEPYSPTTKYLKNNIVRYNKNAYIALQETIGNTPTGTTDSPFWGVIAIGGVDGTGTGTVTSVNGVEPVNGNVTITIPDPDLSGLATKLELQNVDEALTKHFTNDAAHKGFVGQTQSLPNFENFNELTSIGVYEGVINNSKLNEPLNGGMGARRIRIEVDKDTSGKIVMQSLTYTDFASNTGKVFKRINGSSWSGYSRVSYEPWLNATLLSGWTGTIQYRKNDLGQVQLRINVTAGTIANGTVIAKMPNGYLGSSWVIGLYDNSSVKGNLVLDSLGNLKIITTGLTQGVNYYGDLLYQGS